MATDLKGWPANRLAKWSLQPPATSKPQLAGSKGATATPRWGMGMQFDTLRYEREVAVLVRDRASGKPLFEARASNEGNTASAGSNTLAAMFQAALMDFPHQGLNPRQVVVQLP